jgi:hypothetical protein
MGIGIPPMEDWPRLPKGVLTVTGPMLDCVTAFDGVSAAKVKVGAAAKAARAKAAKEKRRVMSEISFLKISQDKNALTKTSSL